MGFGTEDYEGLCCRNFTYPTSTVCQLSRTSARAAERAPEQCNRYAVTHNPMKSTDSGTAPPREQRRTTPICDDDVVEKTCFCSSPAGPRTVKNRRYPPARTSASAAGRVAFGREGAAVNRSGTRRLRLMDGRHRRFCCFSRLRRRLLVRGHPDGVVVSEVHAGGVQVAKTSDPVWRDRKRWRVPVAGRSDRQNVCAVGSCSVVTLICENGDGRAGLSNDDGLVSVSVSRCRNH